MSALLHFEVDPRLEFLAVDPDGHALECVCGARFELGSLPAGHKVKWNACAKWEAAT